MLGLLQYSKGGFEHVAVFFFLLQDHSFLMQAGLQQTFQFLPQKEKKGVAGRLEPAADKTTSAASSIKDAARGNTPAADKESRPRFWHRVPAQEPAGASLSPIFLSAGSLCCRPPEFCTPSIFFCCSLLAGLLHDSRILQQSFLYLQHTSRVPAAGKAHSTAGKKKICCRNVASQREQKQQIRPFADFYGKRFQYHCAARHLPRLLSRHPCTLLFWPSVVPAAAPFPPLPPLFAGARSCGRRRSDAQPWWPPGQGGGRGPGPSSMARPRAAASVVV